VRIVQLVCRDAQLRARYGPDILSFLPGSTPAANQSDTQASKGRTQFVRNISQQSLLRLNKGLNSPRHVVEAQTETANFISAPSNTLVASRIKLAVGDSSGGFTELHYGRVMFRVSQKQKTPPTSRTTRRRKNVSNPIPLSSDKNGVPVGREASCIYSRWLLATR